MPGRRLVALVGLAGRRVLGRARLSPQRVLVSVLGVALAVGLMVSVTGISLGLASQSVVESDAVDYWIVPEDASVQSVAVSTGGVQLGDVHATSEQIGADPRVEYATPVLLEIVPVRDAVTDGRRYVLAIGTVARPGTTVLGLATDSLSPGDPYYANGSYAGTWTGEAVLNDAAATVTNASTGDELAVGGTNRSFRVTNVTAGEAGTGVGTAPVALVHLSELQAMTGATEGDQADQILVATNDRSVEGWLADRYPHTTVVTRSGIGTQDVSTSNLPLAVAVAAFVAALVVGVLFVTTLMSLEISADRRQLATLAAVGVSQRSRSTLVAAETVLVSLLGGVAGIPLGIVAIGAVNAFGGELLGSRVAVFDPALIGYALLVSVVIGLLGALYPVALGRRTDPLETMAR